MRDEEIRTTQDVLNESAGRLLLVFFLATRGGVMQPCTALDEPPDDRFCGRIGAGHGGNSQFQCERVSLQRRPAGTLEPTKIVRGEPARDSDAVAAGKSFRRNARH